MLHAAKPTPLRASIASRFVREERTGEHAELMDGLWQLQADVAELKSRDG